MKRLTAEQWELLESLAKELPRHYTLCDVLKRVDLNPKFKDTQVKLVSVQFHIEGILECAYECTGDIQKYDGTIKEIISDIIYKDVFNNAKIENIEMAKIKDIWDKKDIEELAKFFLGTREETHLREVTATSNSEVTFEEIVNYIRELDVISDFKYRTTVLSF